MTPSELKARYQKANPDGHFFDRETMRYWRDTMKNYGVCRAVITITPEGHRQEVWELYRKKATKDGSKGSAYFTDAFMCAIPFIVESGHAADR